MRRYQPPQAKPSWRPFLGNPGAKEDVGLAVLSALSVAGIHSAINPSIFTLLSFGSQPEGRDRAMKGLWIGLAASSLGSVAIYTVFGKLLPAIIAEATAVGLFGVGVWAINQEAPQSIPAIERQTPTGPVTVSSSVSQQTTSMQGRNLGVSRRGIETYPIREPGLVA